MQTCQALLYELFVNISDVRWDIEKGGIVRLISFSSGDNKITK